MTPFGDKVMTKANFTHYTRLLEVIMTATRPHQRSTADPFRLGLLFAIGSAITFGGTT